MKDEGQWTLRGWIKMVVMMESMRGLLGVVGLLVTLSSPSPTMAACSWWSDAMLMALSSSPCCRFIADKTLCLDSEGCDSSSNFVL